MEQTFKRGLDPMKSMNIGSVNIFLTKVSEIIDKVSGPIETPLTLESDSDTIGLDSLDVVEIIIGIESKFNISIPDSEIMKFKNLNDIFSYLISKKCI